MRSRKKIVFICLCLVLNMILCSCSLPVQYITKRLMDKKGETVRYQDDYYDYVTDDLLAQIDLAPTDAQWTWFGELDAAANEDMEKIIHDIINNKQKFEKGTTEQKIKDLYECVMALEQEDEICYGDVLENLQAIEQAKTIDNYIDAIVQFSADKGFCSMIGGYYIGQDMADSSKYSVYLMGPDTLIGKEYLENDATKEHCDIYFQYMKDCFEVYGMTKEEAQQAETKVESMLRDLCAETLTAQDNYDPQLTYNVFSPEELQDIYSNVNIGKMLSILHLEDVDTFIVKDVNQAKKVNALLIQDNLETLKLYSTFVCLNDVGKFASSELRKLQDKCYNDMNGITESETIEDQAIKDVQDTLSWEFAKIYIEKYFSKDDKVSVEKMIDQIIGSYEKIIDRQEWMSEETKIRAKRKLETMVVKIGYPDEWPPICEQMQITPIEEGGTYLSNMLAYTKIGQEEELAKIGTKVDRTEWSMLPQTVNAYYDPQNNEIVFPAAILQFPFYNKDNDPAVNLGGIGYVIAHEISHAFDANGSLYDEYGNYNPWWSKEETEEFKRLSQSIVDYYNTYEFLGQKVNGELTLSENIADLGAITCITNIIGDDADKLDQMFTQLAYNWACDETVEYGLYLLSNDTHAPNKIRVNAVFSSCDAFYQTYDISETDQMYVAPQMRVGIWK